jgi:hypothetical protein
MSDVISLNLDDVRNAEVNELVRETQDRSFYTNHD